MAKYLATFVDYVNDIEVMGFITLTDKELENFEKLASSITWSFNHKLGEDVLKFSSGEDLLSRIEYKELTTEEYKAIKNIFGGSFGIFIGEDILNQLVNDEEVDSNGSDDGDEDEAPRRQNRNDFYDEEDEY